MVIEVEIKCFCGVLVLYMRVEVYFFKKILVLLSLYLIN